VLGGVCAGVARSAGLDPLLLRIAVVAVTVLSGGAGLLAYLAAWVLIPREDAPVAAQLPAGETAPVDVRAAWSAAGRDLKTLAGELRRPGPANGSAAAPPPPGGTPASSTVDDAGDDAVDDTAPVGTGTPPSESSPTDPPDPVPSQRTAIEAADDAATALGERLRAPEVQAGARQAAASVSQALAASVDEVGRRVRRDRS
jgi:phage shock protein PspC (stress-responsive transcriptional regulator)